MTETNATFANEEVKKEVTVKWSKMTDGIGLVFAGVMSMLEALDASTARDIMTACKMEDGKKEGEDIAAEETGAGAMDDHAGIDDAAVADPADAVEATKAELEKKQEVSISEFGIDSVDDFNMKCYLLSLIGLKARNEDVLRAEVLPLFEDGSIRTISIPGARGYIFE